MKHLLLSLFAFAVITGDGQLVRATMDRPYFGAASDCTSLASALGHGASCKYVQAPSSMVVQP